MEHQEVTMMVLLDLSAAFDVVDHNLVLSIYEKRFRVTDGALQWYESYLHPRHMKVCINDTYSKELSIKYGVPQGSCSRANNFTAYCSPIEDTVPKCVNLSGYADDHSLRKAFKASN